MVGVAPAATACAYSASASSTYRCTVTGEPPNFFGPKTCQSGNSSLSISREFPIWMVACMILPSGDGARSISTALNAFA
jgi:hypothetical protein